MDILGGLALSKLILYEKNRKNYGNPLSQDYTRPLCWSSGIIFCRWKYC
jgi:hypothetical protein